MKKIMAIVLVVLVALGTYAYATPNLSGGIGDIMGQGKFPSDPHKIFRLVRYVPASGGLDNPTLTADSIVIWDSTSDDGVTVTTTTTSYDSRVAGIVAIDSLTPDEGTLGWSAASVVGRRNWTWLQTYGKAEVNTSCDGGSSAAGAAMACSESAGRAGMFLSSTTVSTALGNAGFFYDISTKGTGDAECFLRCD